MNTCAYAREYIYKQSHELGRRSYLKLEEEFSDVGERDRIASLSDMRRAVICAGSVGRGVNPAGVAFASGVAGMMLDAPQLRLGASLPLLSASLSPSARSTSSSERPWRQGGAPSSLPSVCARDVCAPETSSSPPRILPCVGMRKIQTIKPFRPASERTRYG